MGLIWDTLFTSDPEKIVENKKLPIIRIDQKDYKPGEGCLGYWQSTEDTRHYSTTEDEQGL